MNKTRDVLRLFLASPNDVSAERRITETIVAELNRTTAPRLGFLLDLILWEDMLPDMGDAEQIILDQADLDETDVFVGILWNRFGTPTARADSGTEEEFRAAYRAWRKNGAPRILFYFSNRPATINLEAELQQKGRVLAFRHEVESLGLIRTYSDIDDFEGLLRRDLTLCLFDAAARKRGESAAAPSSHPYRCELPKANAGGTGVDGMVLIPAGQFLAGSSASQATIEHDFWIDVTPVTNADFLRFLQETHYQQTRLHPAFSEGIWRFRLPSDRPSDHPVTAVTWYEAIAYAAWRGKRLPTVLEWEKAARGTDGRLYPWGNQFDPGRCNSSESGLYATTSVFRYENGRSPYGCLDMVGNVFEWTNDWSCRPRFSRLRNSEKVNRGGSYNRPGSDLMCWYEESDPPRLRMRDAGFRCVLIPGGNNA